MKALHAQPNTYAWKWEKDIDSTFVSANDNCVKTMGFKSHDDLIGKTDYELRCEIADLADTFRNNDQMVLQKQETMQFLEVLHCADEWRICLITKSPKFNKEKIFVGTEGFAVDITSLMTSLGNLFINNPNKFKSYTLSQNSYAFDSKREEIKLSAKQSECLFLLLRGKTIKEIAAIFKLSPRSVEDRVELLKQKFNCDSKLQLIEKAVHYGYMNVIPKSIINKQLSIIVQ